MLSLKRNLKYKKNYEHIRKEISFIFEFITNNKKHHDIKLMCKVLRVPRSYYYNNINKKSNNEN